MLALAKTTMNVPILKTYATRIPIVPILQETILVTLVPVDTLAMAMACTGAQILMNVLTGRIHAVQTHIVITPTADTSALAIQALQEMAKLAMTQMNARHQRTIIAMYTQPA